MIVAPISDEFGVPNPAPAPNWAADTSIALNALRHQAPPTFPALKSSENQRCQEPKTATTGNYDSFDRFGRTVTVAWKNRSSGAVLDQVDYTYDYGGNRLTRNIPSSLYSADDRDQAYTYDGLHRLKTFDEGTLSGGSISGTPEREEDWTLDQLGNWPTFKERDTDTGSNWDLDQDRDHNEVNELTEFTTTSWVDPAHDDAGNMTTIPQPLAPSSSFTLKYDAWNRMVEVSDTSGTVATYEYDGLGQRIRTDIPGGTSEDLDFYYNDQWQLLTEVMDSTVEAIYHWHLLSRKPIRCLRILML